MEKKNLNSYLLMITYTIALVLLVVHFETVLRGIGFFLRLLRPLFFGIAIAFVLNHLFEHFRTWYRKRWHFTPRRAKICAIVTVYAAAFGFAALIVYMVVPELIQNLLFFNENADTYLMEAQNSINYTAGILGLPPIDLTAVGEIVDDFFRTLSTVASDMLPQIIQVTSDVISGFATVFVSIAISIYIMSGKERLIQQTKRAVRVYLPKQAHPPVKVFCETAYQVFDNYVAGQCKEAVILGSLCFLGMMILRINYASLISIIIAVTSLVPIVGAYVGGVVAVLLLLFVNPGKAVLFLIFLLVLQQVENNVIYPRVVGRKIGLPGMWVLLGIAVSGGLFGVLGMLIGVPVTTILYMLLKKDIKNREHRMKNADAEFTTHSR